MGRKRRLAGLGHAGQEPQLWGRSLAASVRPVRACGCRGARSGGRWLRPGGSARRSTSAATSPSRTAPPSSLSWCASERLGEHHAEADQVVAEAGVERVGERVDAFAEQPQQQLRVAGRAAGLDRAGGGPGRRRGTGAPPSAARPSARFSSATAASATRSVKHLQHMLGAGDRLGEAALGDNRRHRDARDDRRVRLSRQAADRCRGIGAEARGDPASGRAMTSPTVFRPATRSAAVVVRVEAERRDRQPLDRASLVGRGRAGVAGERVRDLGRVAEGVAREHAAPREARARRRRQGNARPRRRGCSRRCPSPAHRTAASPPSACSGGSRRRAARANRGRRAVRASNTSSSGTRARASARVSPGARPSRHRLAGRARRGGSHCRPLGERERLWRPARRTGAGGCAAAAPPVARERPAPASAGAYLGPRGVRNRHASRFHSTRQRAPPGLRAGACNSIAKAGAAGRVGLQRGRGAGGDAASASPPRSAPARPDAQQQHGDAGCLRRQHQPPRRGEIEPGRAPPGFDHQRAEPRAPRRIGGGAEQRGLVVDDDQQQRVGRRPNSSRPVAWSRPPCRSPLRPQPQERQRACRERQRGGEPGAAAASSASAARPRGAARGRGPATSHAAGGREARGGAGTGASRRQHGEDGGRVAHPCSCNVLLIGESAKR